MSTDFRKLTLVCPIAMGEQVVEFLLDLDTPLHGFTTFSADGHGQDFAGTSVKEKVRGRVARKVVMAILPATEVGGLLAEIREQFTSPHMVYWTEPVSELGDFA